MNIQEDFCSQELYELLIGKGFEVNCYDAPFTQRLVTHQSTMKWLREEKDIYITIIPRVCRNTKTKKEFIEYYCSCNKKTNKPPHGLMLWTEKEFRLETYEEAVEAAIKYVLENLI